MSRGFFYHMKCRERVIAVELTRYGQVKKTLWMILVANMLVAVLKIGIGSLIQSTSLTADGYHSLSDGTSNIIGLIGVHFASKPEDEDHPYGHMKFETLAGLAIGGMLCVIGIQIIISALERFFNPVVPEVTWVSLISLLVTLAVNIFVAQYELRRGKALQSEILISDSMHTRSDIYVSIGVLFTLICVKLGLPPVIDSIASVVVAAFILHAAYEIFMTAVHILCDRAVVDTEKIREIAMSFQQVKDSHRIRSRGTQSDIHVDMHIMIEPEVSVEDAHKLIHDIEDKVREELGKQVQVIVHIEPFYGTGS